MEIVENLLVYVTKDNKKHKKNFSSVKEMLSYLNNLDQASKDNIYAFDFLNTKMTSFNKNDFKGFNNIKIIRFSRELQQLISPIDNCSYYDLSKSIKLKRLPSFANNSNLEEIKLPNSIEQVNPFGIFSNCINLKKIDFSKCLNLKDLGSYTFNNCTSLESVKLPKSLLKLNIGSFSGCKSLKVLNLSNLSLLEKGSSIDLSDCINLKEVSLAKNLNICVNGLKNCNKLEIVDMSKSNTSNINLWGDNSSIKTILVNRMDILYKDSLDKLKVLEKIECKNKQVITKQDLINTFDYKDLHSIKFDMDSTSMCINLNNGSVISFEKIKELIKDGNDSNKHVYLIVNEKDKKDVDKLKEIIDIISQYPNKNNFELLLQTKGYLLNKTAYLYTKEEFAKLDEVNNYCLKNGLGELCYQEGEHFDTLNRNDRKNMFKHNEVKKANNSIEIIVDSIKKAKLTPFESIMAIHDLLTNYRYKKELPNTGNEIASRNIVTPFIKDNPEIVCVGYATLLKVLVDKLDMEGLDCKLDQCYVLDYNSSKNSGGHLKNFITIKDDVYNINGTFNEDATWDSKDDKNNTTFAFLLYPLENKYHFKDRLILNDNMAAFNSGNKLYETYNSFTPLEIKKIKESICLIEQGKLLSSNKPTNKVDELVNLVIKDYKLYKSDIEYSKNSHIDYNTYKSAYVNYLNKMNVNLDKNQINKKFLNSMKKKNLLMDHSINKKNSTNR